MGQDATRAPDAMLDQIFEQAQTRSWDERLSSFPAVQELLSSDPALQRQILLLAISRIKNGRLTSGKDQGNVIDLVERLLKRKLPLNEEDLIIVLELAKREDWMQAYSVRALERYSEVASLGESLRASVDSLRRPIRNSARSNQDRQSLLRRVANILDETLEFPINVDTEEPWAQAMLDDLEQLGDQATEDMRELVAFATTASSGKPTAKWAGTSAALMEKVDEKLIRACLTVWISAFDRPRSEEPNNQYYASSVWTVAEQNADTMKGLIWIAIACADDQLVRTIGQAGISGQRKIPGLGPRSAKVTNAAVWALSQIDSPIAVGQLAILRSKIKNKSVQKQIDKAVNAIANRLNVTADEIEEMAVPAYGLTEVGKRTEQLGEFTAELVVTGTTSTEIRWIKPDGKQQKSVPKAVKDDFANDLKELKAAAKDIQKMLPVQRDRIDLMHLKQKTWSYPIWAERYLNHPLVGTIARRLIWVFEQGNSGEKVAATWLDEKIVDAADNEVIVDQESATVSLWHPIGHDESDVLAWRRFFEDREIKQPFKQAHREVYVLTVAERNTSTYSNRFASHVIKQHQFNALCKARGWAYDLMGAWDCDSTPEKLIPEYNLRAEFWVQVVGDEYGTDTTEAGIFNYLSTDQVRFYACDPEEYARDRWAVRSRAEPLPLDQIPPLVLSEIMRDVDLFVGVASVGNDPNWQDGGPEGRYQDYWQSYSFGDLSATAQTRRDILERLVPRLKISERCSFDEKFLIVRGDKRTYKIHLGSSNILMEPNDQYLCIVPGRGAGPGDKVFLPFEGDQRLAVILSKAIMLAEDTKIKDTTILTQIGS